MAGAKVNIFVWMRSDHAQALRDIAEENARRERKWLAEQREALGLLPDEPTPENLRLEVLRLRPDTWPGESQLVDAAMRVRLSAPDLAGPWEPFTPEEREKQRLSGRRTGSPNENFGAKMALDLSTEVVDAALLAAYRVSQPVVAQMWAERLIGPRPKRSREALARKRELQARIFTLGRIARESIATLVQA